MVLLGSPILGVELSVMKELDDAINQIQKSCESPIDLEKLLATIVEQLATCANEAVVPAKKAQSTWEGYSKVEGADK